jgi:hypothetical protein
MNTIKRKVLAVVAQRGQGSENMLLLPMLDRHMVVVEKEKEFIGGKLIVVVRELLAEGFLIQGEGMRIGLTSQGKQLLAENREVIN